MGSSFQMPRAVREAINAEKGSQGKDTGNCHTVQRVRRPAVDYLLLKLTATREELRQTLVPPTLRSRR